MKIILCGFWVVAQSLVKLFESRKDELYAKYGLKPRLIAVFDSKGSAVDQSGLKFNKLVEIKKKYGTVKNYSKENNTMTGVEILKNVEADVLIETTASNYKDAETRNDPHNNSNEKRYARHFSKQRTASISISIINGIGNI